MSKWLGATVAAAISAWACVLVARHGTPVDEALPLVAVTVSAIASLTWPAIGLAVPVLIGGEIVIADERLRLLWFGVVVAVAFAVAVFGVRSSGFGVRGSRFEIRDPRFEGPNSEPRTPNPASSAVLTISAIVLLRWIPLQNVLIGRELVLLIIAVAIAAALRWSAIGVAIAVAVALFTPAIPLRTFIFPIAVLVAVYILREAGMPRLRADLLASFAIALMLLFFPWSGVFARAVPLALRGLPHATARVPVRMALAPGQSVSLDVPANARALILSGANLSRLTPGTVAGAVNRSPVRIGEFADWGFLRREHFYGSRNTIPADPAGELRDYGQSAWVDGAGRIAIPRNARTLVVSADPRLPPAARLQIDAFELVTQ